MSTSNNQKPNSNPSAGSAKLPVSRRLQEAKEAAKKRIEERMKNIPPIHWEILSYANNHTKEQVIEMYPEHIEFIDKIVGFDGRQNGG